MPGKGLAQCLPFTTQAHFVIIVNVSHCLIRLMASFLPFTSRLRIFPEHSTPLAYFNRYPVLTPPAQVTNDPW